MNFQTMLEELDRIYEEADSDTKDVEDIEDTMVEAVDDDMPTEEAPTEESTPEEAKRVILECGNCGALVIKEEQDVVVDEETDLANVDEECQYCEETAGYKIVGSVIPYEAATTEDLDQDAKSEDALEELLDVNVDAKGFGGEGNNVSVLGGRLPALEGLGEEEADLDEGIFDFGKKKKAAAKGGATAKQPCKVTFEIYDENGTKQFAHTFTENPGKKSAEEQLKDLIKDQYPSIYAKCKNYDTANKWQYQRQSVPKQSSDTNSKYIYHVSKLNFN